MSRAVLAGMLMCLLALVGCAALADLAELQSDLEAAGYSSNINHNTTNGHSVLSVSATMPNDVPSDEDADRIAEIVWTRFPGDIDELVVVINGNALLDATADDLTARFGERPDSVPAQGDGGGANVTVIVVALVAGLLVAGLVFLVWWRGRRPPPPAAPPGYPQMPQPYQYPPPNQPGS